MTHESAAGGVRRDGRRRMREPRASAELCARVVDAIERYETPYTTAPLEAQARRCQDRVQRGVTSMSESEARCVADAASLQIARECRKYAMIR
jgi:hypothetical protein